MATASPTEVNMILDDFKIFQRSSKEKLQAIEVDSTSISQKLSVANNKLDQISTIKVQAISELGDVEHLLTQTKEHSDSVSKLASKATDIESNLSNYEDSLNDYLSNFRQLQSEIEGLVSGATSVGLSSAYKERKESFKTPKIVWASVFISSLFFLFIIAAVNPIEMKLEVINSYNFVSYLISKIPFVLPVIWLAIYSSRRHTQTLRLEEDYAHKEALSKSFDGYKKQVEGLDSGLESISPVNSLFKEVLSALTLHPGRIYGKKDIDSTKSLPDPFENQGFSKS